MRLTRNLLYIIVIIVLLSLLASTSFAACSHSLLSPRYSDANHPHEYYRECTSCGIKFYTGTYATKAHGDGSWGSGTCPSCGSHSYVGWSCEQSGYCACGAVAIAYGHTLRNEIYYEVEHPHYGYRECMTCGDKTYTGGTMTKNHGDGSWGSGTCPDCGVHSFSDGTCVQPGTCACGAVSTVYTHSYGTTIYYELAHPHNEFRSCTLCGTKLYLGSTTILPHGNGSSGTCASCGTHNYTDSDQQSEHPHEITHTCACGDSFSLYNISSTCSSCTVNQTTAQGTNSVPTAFLYLDGDNTFGIPISVPFTLFINYSNTYNNPYPDWGNNPDYPAFASFGSSVTLWGDGLPHEGPTLIVSSTTTVNYYSTEGILLRTENLTYTGGGNAISFGCVIEAAPAYAVASGAGSIENGFRLDANGNISEIAYQPISVTVSFP